MSFGNTTLILLPLIVLLDLFVAVTAFRKGQRRLGQLFAYLTAGMALWLLDRLFPRTQPWAFYLGCAVLVVGYLLYYTRVRSLFDWHRTRA